MQNHHWLFSLAFTFLLMPLSPLSAQDDFGSEWKEIQRLIDKNQTRSALDQVLAIQSQAKSQDNQPQYLKALVQRLGLQQRIEEKADSLSVDLLQNEIKDAPFPSKAILQSMLAEVYFGYYISHRWEINQRSFVAESPDDFQTWDARTFFEKSTALHLQAVENRTDLVEVSVRDYKAILAMAEGSERYRPSLYDLLAFRALQFLSNDATQLPQAQASFKLTADQAFLPVADFIALDLDNSLPQDRSYLTWKLFQALTSYQLTLDSPYPLMDTELMRLNYAKAQSADAKDSYQQALEALIQDQADHPASALAMHALANFWVAEASAYDPLQQDERLAQAYLRAHQLTTQAIEKFPRSQGADRCRAVQAEIERKALAVESESAQLPGQPFRVLLQYRNVSRAYLGIIPLDEELESRIRKLKNDYDNRKLIRLLTRATPLQISSTPLPGTEDYHPHRSEYMISNLEAGSYYLLISDHPQFKLDQSAVAFSRISVSNLAYLYQLRPDGKHYFFLRDRKTGAPLPNVKAEVYFSKDYRIPSQPTLVLNTNQAGELILDPKEDYRRLQVVFKQGDDVLRSENMYLRQSNSYRDVFAQGERSQRIHLFTDRAIYRPGQTIYFKGIFTEQQGEAQFTPLINQSVSVRLLDANAQEVATLDLRSNEYGSFHGSFTAPQGVLTGQMTLTTDQGSVSVRVEEYKRPTFEVKLDPLAGEPVLNDSVTVTGMAQSYSGVALDGASVSYRVVRQARFPFWYRWWLPQPSSPAQEIASGELKADGEGKFELTFMALADEKIAESDKPIFSYEVSLEVTDLNGETQGGKQSFRLGYVGQEVQLDIPERLSQADPRELRIRTRNLNGAPLPTQGKLEIYRLEVPPNALRNRLWAQPDQYLIEAGPYRKLFPHDVYARENQKQAWPRQGEAYLTQAVDSEEDPSLSLTQVKDWEPGAYLAKFTTQDGEVAVEQVFTLFDPKAEQPALATWLDASLSQSQAQPGETIRLDLRTSEPELYLRYELWQGRRALDSRWVKLEQGLKSLKIPVDESHRGGLTVYLSYFRENQFQRQELRLEVPWSNKELQLSWETFRSPLLPGQEEEWRLKITGPQAEVVAAEMAATLYDASLESFVPHQWRLDLYPNIYGRLIQQNNQFGLGSSRLVNAWEGYQGNRGYQSYDRLNWFNFYTGGNFGGLDEVVVTGVVRPRLMIRGARSIEKNDAGVFSAAPAPSVEEGEYDEFRPSRGYTSQSTDGIPDTFDAVSDNSWLNIEYGDPEASSPPPPPTITPRRNLQESAFFFPQLRTNEQGEIVLAFTIPEALTRWRFMGLAHTQDLKLGMLEDEVVTQKPLMVIPNLPRFMREGDRLSVSAKLSNLSEDSLSGFAYLELFDALNMQPLDQAFANVKNGRAFQVAAQANTALAWEIQVPEGVQAVAVRITAQAGEFADGEEKILPVLTNRMLVTQSMPFIVKGGEKEKFTFKALQQSDRSKTLRHHQVRLEITENPVWYALQALPYLMEYPYECTEQIFSRYYANSLATHLANSQPQFQRVFEQWRSQDQGSALLSQLEKNQELKSALLTETPWVQDAASDRERKQRLGLLFDLNRMSQEQQSAFDQLLQRQNSDGSFSWFPGMPGSRYVTTLIITGLGHLQQLGVVDFSGNPEMGQAITQAVGFLDQEITKDHLELLKTPLQIGKDNLRASHIQYLYARSFFPEQSVATVNQPAYRYFLGQGEKYWPDQGYYQQGMLAQVFLRKEKNKVNQEILTSLLENTVRTENRGYYWKSDRGWFWYQAPIERQAMLIEAFHEAGGYESEVEEMNLWLLQQKRTQDWGSTRATVEACNALLVSSGNWVEAQQGVEVKVNRQVIDPQQDALQAVEAGSGYYQVQWQGSEINPDLGKIEINNPQPGPTWGAMYWQYFEDLDKIEGAETPLSLRKSFFKVETTPQGPELIPITEEDPVEVGDRIRVRVEIRVDRAMSYVHFKDLRGAGLEPVDALSGYQYQNGLGYYRSIRDASMNYFFERLPQGTWTLEYDLRANLAGDFSNGIASLQCFYAPEYSSHSPGERIVIR